MCTNMIVLFTDFGLEGPYIGQVQADGRWYVGPNEGLFAIA